MITEDLMSVGTTYPSVYLQLDVNLSCRDYIVADMLSDILSKFSVWHSRTDSSFTIHAQKITLDSDNLIVFLALFHDDDIAVMPSVKLHHLSDRRFDLSA